MSVQKDKPIARYDQIASWYDEQVRSESLADNIIIAYLFELIGDVENLHICDLACGQGKVTRQLAQQGAQVVGVDVSSELLAIAGQYEITQPLGINYLQDNAETLSALGDEMFDGVVCNMALMDISNLESTFHSVWRVLDRRGWFVFSITHPCFQTPHSRWTHDPDGTVRREVSHYFNEGFWRSSNTKGVRGQVGAYHRMLSSYLNLLRQTGFILEHIVEPKPQGNVVEQIQGHMIVPSFIMIRARKKE